MFLKYNQVGDSRIRNERKVAISKSLRGYRPRCFPTLTAQLSSLIVSGLYESKMWFEDKDPFKLKVVQLTAASYDSWSTDKKIGLRVKKVWKHMKISTAMSGKVLAEPC